MQDLTVYILIKDPETKQDVSIKGNFEILRAFLSGVGRLEIQADPAPINHPIEEKQQLVTV